MGLLVPPPVTAASCQRHVFGQGSVAALRDQPDLLCHVAPAVWETEESDRTLLSWRQLAEFPLAG